MFSDAGRSVLSPSYLEHSNKLITLKFKINYLKKTVEHPRVIDNTREKEIEDLV